MANKASRISMHLDRDPRLVAGIRAAVLFQCAQVGLDAKTCERFAEAAEDLCRQTFGNLPEDNGTIDVAIETFTDRIEVSLENRGQLIPAIGLETFAVPGVRSGEGRLSGMDLLERVDRVLYNTQADTARTTLVKFLQPSGAKKS